MQREIKGLLVLMSFLDKSCKWRFEVGWKDEWDDNIIRKMNEVYSNLESTKSETPNKEEEILLICEKESFERNWSSYFKCWVR